MDAFFDIEFSMAKSVCDLVSIGCVVVDEDKQVDTYYSLVRPTQPLHWTCKKVTGLKDSDFEHAKSFKKIMKEFKTWIDQYNVNKIYNLGDCDKKVLGICCKKHNVEEYMDEVFFKLQDIQDELSSAVKLNDVRYFSQVSLDNLKRIFNVTGGVNHNALHDAIDLFNVYVKYSSKSKMNEGVIIELVQAKEARKQFKKEKKEKADKNIDILEKYKNSSIDDICIADKFKVMKPVDKIFINPKLSNFIKIYGLLRNIDEDNFKRVAKGKYVFHGLDVERTSLRMKIICNADVLVLYFKNTETNKQVKVIYSIYKDKSRMRKIYNLLKNITTLKKKIVK